MILFSESAIKFPFMHIARVDRSTQHTRTQTRPTCNKGVTHRAHKSQHVSGDVAPRKPSLCIGKEVPPLPLERLKLGRIMERRVLLGDDSLGEIRLQTPSPLSQSATIICFRITRSIAAQWCRTRKTYALLGFQRLSRENAPEMPCWPR